VLDLSCRCQRSHANNRSVRAIRKDLGEPDVLLYNAGSGTFGAISEITPDQYEADWRSTPSGVCRAKEVAPAMIARGRGTMLFTGATAGVKAGRSQSRLDPRSSRCAAWRNH